MGDTDQPVPGALELLGNRLAETIDAGMTHGTEGSRIVEVVILGTADRPRATGAGLVAVAGVDRDFADVALAGLALRGAVTELARLAALVVLLVLLAAPLGRRIIGLQQRAPGHRGQSPGEEPAHRAAAGAGGAEGAGDAVERLGLHCLSLLVLSDSARVIPGLPLSHQEPEPTAVRWRTRSVSTREQERSKAQGEDR